MTKCIDAKTVDINGIHWRECIESETMDTTSNNSLESSIRCDFPARESFREALLQTLLSMDEGELTSASSDKSAESRKTAGRKIKLEDADLEMLAAAEGEDRVFKNPFEDPLEQ